MPLETADTIPSPPPAPSLVSTDERLDRVLVILADELPRITAFQHASADELVAIRRELVASTEAMIDIRRHLALLSGAIDLLVAQGRSITQRLTALGVQLDRHEDTAHGC